MSSKIFKGAVKMFLGQWTTDWNFLSIYFLIFKCVSSNEVKNLDKSENVLMNNKILKSNEKK